MKTKIDDADDDDEIGDDTGAEETLARIMGMKSARDTSQQQNSERKKHQKR